MSGEPSNRGAAVGIELRPRRLVLVCRTVAVVVVVTFAVLALLLPRGSSDGQQFGVADQVAFFGIGVLLASAAMVLTRARVQADQWGVRVRNVFGERTFPWPVVVAVTLADGAPWASLELHDDETVPLLALQANDRERTVDGVLALRQLLGAAAAG